MQRECYRSSSTGTPELPGRASLNVPTTQDHQEVVQLEVFQGEAGPIDQAEYFGALVYRTLPPLPAGQAQATFDFALDAEGLLTITASHNRGGTPEVVRLATLERHVDSKPEVSALATRPSRCNRPRSTRVHA